MTTNPTKPLPITTTTTASPSETGTTPAPDRQDGPVAKTPKKGRPKKAKAPTTDDERVVSLSLPADLLKRVKVLSALTGESISQMVAGALAAKVKRELRAAMADLAD